MGEGKAMGFVQFFLLGLSDRALKKISLMGKQNLFVLFFFFLGAEFKLFTFTLRDSKRYLR